MTAERPGTDERRIRVLWNPTSGRKGGIPTNGASRAMLLDLMSRHGLGDELIEPGSEEEAAEAASDAVDRGYEVVVAAGGDGTIGLVGRQLIGTRTALGILPLGSVMNIPRMLGVPRDLEEAARILADGHVRTIDVGQVGDRIFYEAGSVGHACRRRRASCPWWTRATTGRSSGRSWPRSAIDPPRCASSSTATATIEAKAVAASRSPMGRSWVRGSPSHPRRSLDDGLFDVRVFLHYTKAELVRHFTSIAFGRRAPEAALTDRAGGPGPHHEPYDRCRRVPTRSDLGTTPVAFEIRPRVLTVVVPDPIGVTGGSGWHAPHLPIPGRASARRPLGAAMRRGPTQRPGTAATAPRPGSHR